MLFRALGALLFASTLGACASSPTATGDPHLAGGSGGAAGASTGSSSSQAASSTDASSSSVAGSGGAGPSGSSGAGGMDAGLGGSGGAPAADSLTANRDRLLGTYLDFLHASVPSPQSNGLSGPGVTDVCDLWTKLHPSSQSVFLTLTARLQGSKLGSDGSSMLSHVTRVYRIAGGEGETQSDPGSCGGGEFNRMIMSSDSALHDAQNAAVDHKGANQANGKPDILDAPQGTFWRDSHDLGGPHSPFDASDETDKGAPRGQTQYFKDWTSAAANAPLGRQDLTTLVDPQALEMDQDYDCIHSSNPLCTYVTYGALCFPEAAAVGTDVYAASYGSIDASYRPTGCP